MKVSKLCGAELDYWTALAVNLNVTMSRGLVCFLDTSPRCKDYGIPSEGVFDWNPSSNWQLCGKLIEKYELEFFRFNNECRCRLHHEDGINLYLWSGQTPQEAICRSVVASVYGQEVSDETT